MVENFHCLTSLLKHFHTRSRCYKLYSRLLLTVSVFAPVFSNVPLLRWSVFIQKSLVISYWILARHSSSSRLCFVAGCFCIFVYHHPPGNSIHSQYSLNNILPPIFNLSDRAVHVSGKKRNYEFSRVVFKHLNRTINHNNLKGRIIINFVTLFQCCFNVERNLVQISELIWGHFVNLFTTIRVQHCFNVVSTLKRQLT